MIQLLKLSGYKQQDRSKKLIQKMINFQILQNLYKLTIHALKVFSVFKYKVFFYSLIYSIIFLFLGKNFYFLIYIIILANILIFGVSLNSKKKFDNNFISIIKKVEIIN